MNNKLYERNRIKKKVFVKERVNVVKNRFTMDVNRESKPSLLADFIGKSKKNDQGFMLNTPNEKDPNSIKTKIYFFSTPRNFEIHISKKDSVFDVIRHIITLYLKDSALSTEMPLKFPKNPDAYELRLIEDEDEDE
jgi:hypothetical protein